MSTKQQQIAEWAKQDPQRGFTSLNHHLDLLWLAEAFYRTRQSAAPGVDGQTADDYGLNLRDNLQSLRDRAKSGTYWASPVRRVRIPKGTGNETRPLGIPTLEDKVLQRAVVMALEPIYEQDFLDCSYGFRPGRSAHAALAALWQQTMDLGGCWLVEVDVRQFFDTLDHAHLRDLLARRVRDGVLLRLIGKWLNAGVLEEGTVTYPDQGTPQGGVVTPPTILLTAPFGAFVKRAWIHLVDHADRFLTHFDVFDQGTKDRTACVPIRFAKSVADTLSERCQLLHRSRAVGFLRLAFRGCLCLAF